jgi:hypothetical protein
VHNAGEVPTVVRVDFGNTDAEMFTILAAGAVGEFRTTGIQTGTRLYAILTATQPVAAVVTDFGPDGKQVTGYAAMGASLGFRRVTLPDVYSEAGGGWHSEIAVQNVGHTTSTVTIAYTRTNEHEATIYTDTVLALPPGHVQLFDPSQASGLPADFVGIASVRSDEPVVAVAYNAALGGHAAYVYQADAAPRANQGPRPLYLPMLVNTFEDWQNSEIQIMNAGTKPALSGIQVGQTDTNRSIDPWGAQSFPQITIPDEDCILSPAGEIVPGRVTGVESLRSLVWLNGKGSFAGDPLAAYSAVPGGALTWYFPFSDQAASSATYLAVQNPNGLTANIILTVHTITGTAESRWSSIGAEDVAYFTGGAGLPSEMIGGVVVQADIPVAAVAAIAGRLVLDHQAYLPLLASND